MRNISLIGLLGFLLLVCGCKNEDEMPSSYDFMDIGLEFLVVDKDGNNLIDSNLPNSINSSEIKIFYERNGKKIPASEILYSEWDQENVIPDDPDFKAFSIITPNQNTDKHTIFCLRLDCPYISSSPELFSNRRAPSTTYIQWKEGLEDKITCTMYDSPGFYNKSNVYLNGTPLDTKSEWLFTIVH